MKNFSKSWKSSKNPGKQRKYRITAPLHIKHSLVNAHLSKELRKKFGKRSVALRKGDKVRVIAGKFKKHDGRTERIDLKHTKVFVSGMEITKKDGSKKPLALHPSNLMIMELNLDDKLRQKTLERK